MNIKFAVVFLALGVALASLPDAPANYTVQDKKVPSSSSDSYDFWKGGAQTVTDCSNRCNSVVGCVGFTFQYLETTTSAQVQLGSCKGYADASNSLTLVDAAKTTDGDAGSAYFERDEAVTVAAAPVSFKGASTLDVPAGYTVWDRNACDKENGGNMQTFSIGKVTKDLTGAQCAQLCDAYKGCIGFGSVYDGSYKGYCTGYTKGTISTLGCRLDAKSETGNAFYFRNAGEVITAACAPAGTDINGFTACTRDFSAAPGAHSSSTAVPLFILSVLAAVWAL